MSRRLFRDKVRNFSGSPECVKTIRYRPSRIGRTFTIRCLVVTLKVQLEVDAKGSFVLVFALLFVENITSISPGVFNLIFIRYGSRRMMFLLSSPSNNIELNVTVLIKCFVYNYTVRKPDGKKINADKRVLKKSAIKLESTTLNY